MAFVKAGWAGEALCRFQSFNQQLVTLNQVFAPTKLRDRKRNKSVNEHSDLWINILANMK